MAEAKRLACQAGADAIVDAQDVPSGSCIGFSGTAAIYSKEDSSTSRAIGSSPLSGGGKAITAVFDVELRGLRLDSDGAERLSEYLVGRIAATGRYLVVPRDQVRGRLAQEKASSYQQCFDQSCQIEMGKELAAQKIVTCRIVRVGSTCAVNLTSYDLLTAATEGGSSIEGGCDEDAIVASLRDAIARLTAERTGRE